MTHKMVLLISNNAATPYAYSLKSTLDYKPQMHLSSEKASMLSLHSMFAEIISYSAGLLFQVLWIQW